ncbi:pseudouridine synthase [Candidatus Stoquefichus massiliensis]|uniref:pseudouridine synthase n=1 Tax=Candidatus Stoquefichus massiliensis TaxID=1470350 RepID=UPI0004887D6A|nr:pseudouridine synthase [Candidatus Stoquefichus massiliensis]
MERLQKAIASSGYTSRRKAEELIRQGRVKVNGEVVSELGFKVKQGDIIMVDNKTLEGENKVYYVFYKPKGCICSLSDELGRKTVIDYFREIPERIYPVGRLDYDTTGLLLMSNDGEFANLMMHPSSHLEKVYEVSISGLVTGETLNKLEKGIYLEGVKTLPCKIKVVGKDVEHKTTMLMIKLMEGKNRQVKKMFESMGHRVKRLHRISVGGIELKGLRPGEYRRLKPQEVKELKTMALTKKTDYRKR